MKKSGEMPSPVLDTAKIYVQKIRHEVSKKEFFKLLEDTSTELEYS